VSGYHQFGGCGSVAHGVGCSLRIRSNEASSRLEANAKKIPGNIRRFLRSFFFQWFSIKAFWLDFFIKSHPFKF
jgi:hypothetical protein